MRVGVGCGKFVLLLLILGLELVELGCGAELLIPQVEFPFTAGAAHLRAGPCGSLSHLLRPSVV